MTCGEIIVHQHAHNVIYLCLSHGASQAIERPTDLGSNAVRCLLHTSQHPLTGVPESIADPAALAAVEISLLAHLLRLEVHK